MDDYFDDHYPETDDEDAYSEYDYEDDYEYGPVALVDA
jgi:hypothetical protein